MNRLGGLPVYPVVLFDWDGCLAQTLTVWMDAYMRTFAAFDLTPSKAEIGHQFGDLCGPLTLGVSESELDAFVVQLEDEVSKGLSTVSLYPGAGELVADLRSAGVKTALITTGKWRQFGDALSNHGLASSFDAIISGTDVKNHKPDPEPIQLALSKLGVGKDGAVMIGDSSKDLGAANNAGVDSILFFPVDHNTYYALEDLLTFEPTHTCDSFTGVRQSLFAN